MAGGILGAHGLEAEGVVALGNHGQGDGGSIAGDVHLFGFKPRAEAWVVDFWLTVPEIGFEAALNLEMVEKQLDDGNALWEIAPDIVHAHVEGGDSMSFALSFDYHIGLPFYGGFVQFTQGGWKGLAAGTQNPRYRFPI